MKSLRTLFQIALIILLPNLVHAAEPQKATFAAGCFWCLESIFEHVPGVADVTPGYAGGTVPNPTYEQVCTGTTGHAETIELTYDPDKVTYSKLVEIFWKSFDPTDGRGVAPDFGPQYRSIIFYRTPDEKRAVEQIKATLEKSLSKPVATQIVPFEIFYPAEEYHKDYVKKNPDSPYVRGVSLPRLKSTGVGE